MRLCLFTKGSATRTGRGVKYELMTGTMLFDSSSEWTVLKFENDKTEINLILDPKEVKDLKKLLKLVRE